MSVQDRLLEKKFAKHLRDLRRYPRKPFCRFDGRLYVGVDSLHRTPPARRIHMIQRIKNYPYMGLNLEQA